MKAVKTVKAHIRRLKSGKTITVRSYKSHYDRASREKVGNDYLKRAQLSLIKKENPMLDDYHVGIRSVDDILTLQEAVNEVIKEDPAYDLSAYPDVSDDMIRDALRTGKITIYSSYPIKNGVFVTPSMMQAKDYAGGMRVYSKEVPITDVAWITPDEGQFAKIKRNWKGKDSKIL